MVATEGLFDRLVKVWRFQNELASAGIVRTEPLNCCAARQTDGRRLHDNTTSRFLTRVYSLSSGLAHKWWWNVEK